MAPVGGGCMQRGEGGVYTRHHQQWEEHTIFKTNRKRTQRLLPTRDEARRRRGGAGRGFTQV